MKDEVSDWFACAWCRHAWDQPPAARLFRPAPIHPDWLTPKVKSLAAEMHDTGNFKDMPTLGETLEEAGCRDEELLGHCREGGHVRGCWLVDMIVQAGSDDD